MSHHTIFVNNAGMDVYLLMKQEEQEKKQRELENEVRALKGEEPLPPIKGTNWTRVTVVLLIILAAIIAIVLVLALVVAPAVRDSNQTDSNLTTAQIIGKYRSANYDSANDGGTIYYYPSN